MSMGPFRHNPVLRALGQGALVLGTGLALYISLAAVQRALDMALWEAVLSEEALKGAVLFLAARFGVHGIRAQALLEKRPPRRGRMLALGAARGLSWGLAGIAAFAGIENLAYLWAFPEAGVLLRLGWSLPVHLVAALIQALGLLPLVRPGGSTRWGWRLVGLGAAFGGAVGVHGAANLLANGHPPVWVLGLGSGLALLGFLLLLFQFLKCAYLGGFLHGTDA